MLPGKIKKKTIVCNETEKRSQIPLRYLVPTSSEPASVMEFGFKQPPLLSL